MDFNLKQLLDGTLLPDPGALLEKLTPILGVLLMAGPVLMVIMGLLYRFAAPKEANHHFGYRCYFGMGSVQAWRFTQRLAGTTWIVLGVILGIAMVIAKRTVLTGLEPMDLLLRAVICILGQVGVLLLATVVIRLVVACTFDRHGVRRSEKRQQRKEKQV